MAIWTAPSDHARLCGVASTALRPKRRTLWRNAEVDHRVPLFRVWNEHRETPWPKLLGFWGLPNLQVINRENHVAKCAGEAGDRSAARRLAAFHRFAAVTWSRQVTRFHRWRARFRIPDTRFISCG
jgi:hypothetical protein